MKIDQAEIRKNERNQIKRWLIQDAVFIGALLLVFAIAMQLIGYYVK